MSYVVSYVLVDHAQGMVTGRTGRATGRGREGIRGDK